MKLPLPEDPLRRSKIGVEVPLPPYHTGGAAYPTYPTDDGKYGISLLDFFAAHVLGGLAARTTMSIDDLKVHGPEDAYWIAALMVDLRGRLPIETTPVPPPEETPPPIDTTIPPPPP